jgi:hypothetical protein
MEVINGEVKMEVSNRKIWGMELKALREFNNLSIECVAQRLGKSVSTIKRYEGINPLTTGKSYKDGVSQTYIDEFFKLLNSMGLSTTIEPIKPTVVQTVSIKKASRYDNLPTMTGAELKSVMAIAGVTDQDILTGYITTKGSLIDRVTLGRYKNVTTADIAGGQAYSRGISVKFVTWLYAHISHKYITA